MLNIKDSIGTLHNRVWKVQCYWLVIRL